MGIRPENIHDEDVFLQTAADARDQRERRSRPS